LLLGPVGRPEVLPILSIISIHSWRREFDHGACLDHWGHGFIGRYLARWLADKGHTVPVSGTVPGRKSKLRAGGVGLDQW